MIALRKLAKVIVRHCLASGRVTKASNHRAYLRQASLRLVKTYDCTKLPSDILPQWNENEVAAAEVICWMTAFLERQGCRNVEQLIRDVIAWRGKHPDRPSRS